MSGLPTYYNKCDVALMSKKDNSLMDVLYDMREYCINNTENEEVQSLLPLRRQH